MLRVGSTVSPLSAQKAGSLQQSIILVLFYVHELLLWAWQVEVVSDSDSDLSLSMQLCFLPSPALWIWDEGEDT